MLTSCISADRPDLGIEIPWSYRAAPPATKLAPPKLDWWRGFRSKELTDLIQEAHTGNFDIAIAVARIMQADANSKIASAPMLPSVNLESSATRTKSSAAANGGVGSTKNNFTAFLNASYEIDFWGKNRAASKAAEELAISARFDRDTVSISTVVSVATAYFLVLESQDRLRIARENVMAAENILNLIRKRASGEGGTASQLEVSQQEVLVGQQRSLIPQFDQTLRQNIATLAVLVGRAPSFMKVRGGSLYNLGLPAVSPGLPSTLLVQRPDIRSAEAQLVSADASVVAARAAFYPSITLTGQYGVASTALRNLFSPQAIFYQIAAGLVQPIFDGFQLEGQLELARGRQVELLNTYRKTIVTAFGDVEQALIAIEDTTKTERAQRQVVASAQEAFKIVQQRLEAGTVDNVTLLVTQQALFTAQDNLVQGRFARLQAILSLYQALGGGWFPPTPKGYANANR